MVPDAPLVARFAVDLDRLSPAASRIAVAVSGGPDSVALLLLATAARPALVEAATVDHGLRPEARAEAESVADLCGNLGVPHTILTLDWPEVPTSAVQERARDARYGKLGEWMRERDIGQLCTGHHRGDQAETFLMRLDRGAGVRGLGGMKGSASLPGHPDLILLRPLLDWSREKLAALCAAAGVEPVDDPSNRDHSYERVRTRDWIGQAGIDEAAIGRSARHLQEADAAIAWAADREWDRAVTETAGGIDCRTSDVPAEISRRIVARAVAALATEGDSDLRGGEVDRLLETLRSGGVATLRGVRCEGGSTWRFRPAPSRSFDCG